MLTLSLLVLCLSEPVPSPAAHRAAQERRLDARTGAALPPALAGALEELPELASIAIIVPDPGALLDRGLRELARAGAAFPGLAPSKLNARLTQWIGIAALGREQLERAGVSLTDRWIVLPDLSGGVPLIRVGLADRRRFEAWADQRAHRAPKLRIGDDRAWILFSSAEAPLLCTARGRAAYCQLGVSAGPDPAADLRRLLETPSRRLSQLSGPAEALQRLGTGAHAYVIVRPDAVATLAADLIVSRTLQEHRFDPPDRRRAAEAAARRQVMQVRSWARSVEGIAAGFTLETSGLRGALELGLDRRAAALVEGLIRPAAHGGAVQGWLETPALAGLLLRLEPDIASDLLSRGGLSLPPALLSGTVAALALGLDAECSAAKRGGTRDPSALPFLFPTALAVGLLRQPSAEERRALAGSIGVPADEEGSVLRRGFAHGSPYEVRLAEHAVLVGTGPGSGAAALRRWSNATPPENRVKELPFAELKLDLQAVDAALASGAFTDETRAELKQLELLRRRVRPLLSRYERLSAVAHAREGGSRIRVELTVGE